MVKSTVRFSESVVEEIDTLVEEGYFESKSEFYRFASDFVLDLIVDDYRPETIDYEQIKSDVIPSGGPMPAGESDGEELPFFESLVLVRKYVLRGNMSDAEDFIDHHYSPDDRHALILEEYLEHYRSREPSEPEETARSTARNSPR